MPRLLVFLIPKLSCNYKLDWGRVIGIINWLYLHGKIGYAVTKYDGAGGYRYAIFRSIGVVTPRRGFQWPRPPHFASGRTATRLSVLFALETSWRMYCLSPEDLSAEDLPTEGSGPLFHVSNRRHVYASFRTICVASSLIATIYASLQRITRPHKRLNTD
jgi:hypothetical protein